MDKDTVEQLVAAQLAAGMLGTVLDPNDDVEAMASTSVQLYQLVLSEVRKQGAAAKPIEPSNVMSLKRRKKEAD